MLNKFHLLHILPSTLASFNSILQLQRVSFRCMFVCTASSRLFGCICVAQIVSRRMTGKIWVAGGHRGRGAVTVSTYEHKDIY